MFAISCNLRSVLITGILLVSVLAAGTEGKRGDGKRLSRHLSGVTGKLHKRATEAAGDGKNVVISPFSISVTLGMVLLGADGNTKFELERFTSWPSDTLHEVMKKKIYQTTSNENGPKVSLNNAIFMDEDFDVKQTFITRLQDNYQAEQNNVDFSGNPVESAEKMNAWIEDKTDGNLKDVIPEDLIDSMTKAVLINVIHFVGTWSVAFKDEEKEMDFYPSFNKENSVRAQFLVQDNLPVRISYDSTLRQHGVFFSIPYETKRHGSHDFTSYFVIGKPNTKEDLDWINNNLEKVLVALKPIKANMRSVKVDVKIPKFDVSQDLNVKQMLMKEGVRDLFDESSCDLTGMHNGGTHDIYVSDYLHKAKVRIDAKGTVASAASVVISASRSYIPPPPPIVLDTPFFFGIYYARINAFLFTGVINDPTA